MAAGREIAEITKASRETSTYYTYLGISFSVFLAFLPQETLSFISSIQARNRSLSLKLLEVEEELMQLRSRRKEDSRANARVVEIFASHRNGWQQEEKRLLQQIDESARDIMYLKTKISELENSESELKMSVEKLHREIEERDEMISFMSRKNDYGDFVGKTGEISKSRGESGRNGNKEGIFSAVERVVASQSFDAVFDCYLEKDREVDESGVLYRHRNAFSRELIASASKAWTEIPSNCQGSQYEYMDSMYHTKHFVSRRESPWKVDCESTGIPSKLKSLDHEIVLLEKIGTEEIEKVLPLFRKQAKRYQDLAGKINDLCRRMQASDPCEATLVSEFQTQRQMEFLLEAFRIQQQAVEIGQKLPAMQTEIAKSCLIHRNGTQHSLNTKRCLDSIRMNFREIQRNLEVWMARIIGDLEGILARDSASRVREYYLSRYPFVR